MPEPNQPYTNPGGDNQRPNDYQQRPYQQPPMQQPPVTPPHYQSGSAGYQAPPQPATPIYPMSDTDRTLRLIAFIFNIISLAASCWAIIPLAWMIPMCVMSWRIYKGTRANTTAFGVCTLLFVSLIGGILLLCSKKEVPHSNWQ